MSLSTRVGKTLDNAINEYREEDRDHEVSTVPPTKRGPLGGTRTVLWTAGLFSAFLTVSQLIIPLFSMQIFDRVIPTASLPTLVALSLVTAGLVLISSTIDACRSILLGRLANHVYFKYYEFIAQRMTTESEKALELLRNLDLIRGFLSGSLSTALLDLPCTLAFLAVIFFLHPILGDITAISCLIMFGLGLATHYTTRTARLAASELSSLGHGLLDDITRSRSSCGSMGIRERLLRRLFQVQERQLRLSSSANERQAMLEALSRGTRNLVQIIILSCAAYLVVARNAESGSIVAASMLLSRTLYPIERLAGGFPSFITFINASRRIKSDARSYITLPPAFELPRLTGAVEVKNVFFVPSRGARPVLQAINLSVKSGEVLAVVGREGAGKSALARLLVGLEMPTLGEVRFDGSKLGDFDAGTLGDQIGFLPEVFWIDGTTVAGFISRGRSDAEPNEIVRVAELFGMHSTIQTLVSGYQTEINSRRTLLSSGQLQRLALARAFYGFPKIIVLDEPALHLDDTGETLLLKAMQAYKHTGTTFVVASRLPGLLHLADQLLMLEDGSVRLTANQDQMHSFLSPRLATSQVS